VGNWTQGSPTDLIWELGRFVGQNKRKSKVHPLAGGWEDTSRNLALGSLRIQAFLVVCTDGDVIPRKLVYVSLTLIVWARCWWRKPIILIVRVSIGQPHEDWTLPHHRWLAENSTPSRNKHSTNIQLEPFTRNLPPSLKERLHYLRSVKGPMEHIPVQWPSWELSLGLPSSLDF
jgi:hypothetical protein